MIVVWYWDFLMEKKARLRGLGRFTGWLNRRGALDGFALGRLVDAIPKGYQVSHNARVKNGVLEITFHIVKPQ